jgi:polyisoprenoid-binding protein YceI
MNASVARFLLRLSGVALAAATLAVAAAVSGVDAIKSQITATFRQMNVPVEGRFNNFRGSVDFDPKNAAAGRARIEIDTSSFDVGAPEYNEELRGEEWFDTPTYPKASFVSSSVSRVGQNRFEAKGRLTLKGKTQEIKVPFTQRSDGGVQVYEGELPISRKAYAIGSAEWDDTLEDKVIVKFRITTAAR